MKDVIQSLVDDDLVFKDKIGTSVSRCFYGYSFELRDSFLHAARICRACLVEEIVHYASFVHLGAL